MASLRDIRKRIRSVKSSQKITKAMKLVAASKLRRAQESITAARPYAVELGSTLRRLSTRVGTTETGQAVHPLLEVREPKRVLLVVITSDRGLCGAFNATILRRAERFVRENEGKFEKLEVATIGKKAREYFARRKIATTRDFPGVFEQLNYMRAQEISKGLVEEFVAQDLDAVFLLYNEFKSAISQKVVVQELLPVTQAELPEESGQPKAEIDYLYEPSKDGVLEHLMPRYVTTLVWRALLESWASEQGARMTAMDSASKNAKELADKLTLSYNRTRQAAITRELMEIISGAEALNG